MKYYGVERSTDHLAHYGVKGMRWGVRKAIATGNQRSLDRHYRKAAKKLAKLQDIGLNSKKYAAKSAAYGVAAAGTGTIAIGGTNLIGSIVGKHAPYAAALYKKSHPELLGGSQLREKMTDSMAKSRAEAFKKHREITNAGKSVKQWGERPVGGASQRKVKFVRNGDGTVSAKRKLTYNDALRIGSGAVALGLAVKSGQNAYRASHGAKYRDKAVNWKNEMDMAFSGTKYEGHYEKPPRQRRRRRG